MVMVINMGAATRQRHRASSAYATAGWATLGKQGVLQALGADGERALVMQLSGQTSARGQKNKEIN